MSGGYWLGLATIPAIALVVAVVLFGPYVVAGLARRWLPAHWSLAGPQRRRSMTDPRRLFRTVNAAGRHLASFRRVVTVGPWTLYVGRYRPGEVADDER